MKKRELGTVIAWVLLVSLALTLPAAAASYWGNEPEESVPIWVETSPVQERTAPVMLIPQSGGEHVGYMNGTGQGLFQPGREVTRAELAQMLNAIMMDFPEIVPSFSDVAWEAWYAPAVERVTGLGLMTGTEGLFRPDAPATRAECAAALALLIPYEVAAAGSFPDVGTDHWAYEAISRTAAQGLLCGDDQGNFRPDDSLLRCEAAAVFNRLLGRKADVLAISRMAGLCSFSDVPATHWAYAEIVEATVSHRWTYNLDSSEGWISAEVSEGPGADPVSYPDPPAPAPSDTGLSDGPHRIDGRLYWVRNGEFVRNEQVNALYFDENGCYTTGNTELDERLNAIVEELTDDSMTRDEKLRAMYNYIRDNFRYLKRPLISKGQTGWEADYALYFLQNGKGNCYNFSAAYCLLCRELGLPAYVVVGSALNSPHGWVEIELDGDTYMFDTQLEWRYLHDWGKTGYDLFKMPAGKTPFKYTR